MVIAVDIETTMVNEESPTPLPICISTYDGSNSEVKTEVIDTIYGLLRTEHTLVFHNISFDLGVYLQSVPEDLLLICDKIKKGSLRDTYIIEKLKVIETTGLIHSQRYSLEALSLIYLGLDISEDKASGSPRYRYGEMQGKPLEEYPEEFVEYAKKDTIVTYDIYQHVKDRKSPNEALHTYSSLILKLMSMKGFNINTSQVARLKEQIEKLRVPLQEKLIEYGLATITKKGEFKKNTKELREYISTKYPSKAQKSSKGNFLTSKDALEMLSGDPMIDCLLNYKEIEKLITTYVPALESATKGVIYPSFDPLKDSGRMSSYVDKSLPSIGLHQLPRKVGVRECFEPSEGYKLTSVDYSMLELCSVAQETYNLFGASKMRDAINEGYDLHCLTGSKIYSMDIEPITYEAFKEMYTNNDEKAKYYRTLAKPINLGYPGGLGPKKMQEIAKKSYGVDMTYREAVKFREIFFSTYPELPKFFTKYLPHNKLLNGTYKYTVEGHTRAGCTFCQVSNGQLMQTRAAIGFKYALCRLYSVFGTRIKVPFHDEFIVEVKEGDYAKEMRQICSIMLKEMSRVMPDVRLNVEADLMKKYWTKSTDQFEHSISASIIKGVISYE